jgi:hypothetical protein
MLKKEKLQLIKIKLSVVNDFWIITLNWSVTGQTFHTPVYIINQLLYMGGAKWLV